MDIILEASTHYAFRRVKETRKLLIIKPTRCTNFSNLFCDKTLHVSDSCSVHHQEFFTVHTAALYVYKFGDSLRAGSGRHWFRPDPACKLSAKLYDIYHCCVYSKKTPDDRQRNCPKHAVFSINKFGKLGHLVGFFYQNLSRCTVTWTSNTKDVPILDCGKPL